MGKFRPKTFGITILAIATVITIILFSVNGDGAIGAIIPPPALELVTTDDGTFIIEPDGTTSTIVLVDSEIPNIACWIKQEVTVFQFMDDRDLNRPLFILKSPFFQSQPFLSLPLGSVSDTLTGIELNSGVWVTRPEIKCVSGEIDTSFGGVQPIGTVDPDDPNLFSFFPSVSAPLTVQDSFFKVRVYAELPTGTWKEVFNTHYVVERFDITSASSINLEPVTIRQEWIEPYLPEGDYTSKYRIVYDGAFLMNWKLSGICGSDCAKIPFVIPVVTEKTFNEQGKLLSLFNEFQVSRDVTVGKPTGSGEDTITCDEFSEQLNVDTGLCETINASEQPCPQGSVRSGAVCIEIGDDPNDPNPSDVSVPFGDLLSKIQTCLASGDPTCLASAELLPLWIFGIGAVVIIGAVAQRRQPDIYGVPNGGF
jgi:hypothetical protein